MSRAILTNALLDHLLIEADPDLEHEPEVFTRALRAQLRPLLNQVVKACRTPEDLPAVVARMRSKAAATNTTAKAFALFVHNIAETGELAIA